MKNNNINNAIPLGELKCIWMTAGVVDYKLCDKNYCCDSCDYYDKIRKGISDLINNPESKESINNEMNLEEKIQSLLTNYTFEEDLLYKENHTWVRVIDPYKVEIGLDSVAGKLLPKNKVVILPVKGNCVFENKPCSWIAIEDDIFTIKSPVTGFVKEINSELVNNPGLLNDSPYNDGWLFRVQPTRFERDIKYLYSDKEFMKIVSQDIEKIRKKIMDSLVINNPSVGNTMMDGGKILNHFSDILGQKKFNSILDCIFKFFV